MYIKKLISNKYIFSAFIVLVISVLLEIFVFNFSSFRCDGKNATVLAQDVTTDEESDYYTDVFTFDDYVKNVDVELDVENHDLAYVSVMLTDEGDKYEYSTPEYIVCDGIRRSGFSNIYPFGKVHTIQVKVRVDEGCVAHIRSINANAHIPVDIKPVRFLLVFAVLWLGYLIFADTALHTVCFDEKKGWQWIVTVIVMILLLVLGSYINKADPVLMGSPWPHHSQYQELARSLDKGTVELTEQYVDPRLLETENPYDTITLQAEGISYSMDYAFYDGHYYVYFGIVPEVLFYFPYYRLKGADLANYKVMYILFVLLLIGVFATITGLVRRYFKSLPYVFYLLICAGTLLCANFVYLTVRSDIYNIPILCGVAFSFIGIGLWLEALNTDKKAIRRTALAAGSFSMALVAGCRPQLLLLSGIAIILFFFEDGFKNRRLFTKESVVDTICFCLPYVLVAIPVCWYNYVRFGSITDFGATYSLTTNDMNHRGFNMNRLLRSLYCYLFQTAVMNTDFPFLNSSYVEGGYMGRLLTEHTYGGMLVSNAVMVSLWLGLITGLKKLEKPIRYMVAYTVLSAVIIAGFDANCAGVLYRYTCDFAPAFMLAAIVLWMAYLDRARHVIDYRFASRLAYICFVLAGAYAFLTFIASGNSVCLENDNRQLFYLIRDYFVM